MSLCDFIFGYTISSPFLGCVAPFGGGATFGFGASRTSFVPLMNIEKSPNETVHKKTPIV